MKMQQIILVLLVLTINMQGQNRIQVAEHATVHLICPEAVSYVQVGSHAKLIAETVPDYPHIVRIKAIKAFLDTSSLTLVCANRLYAFRVSCHKQCALQLKLSDYNGADLQEQHGTSLSLHQMLTSMHQLQTKEAGKSIKSTKSNQIKLRVDDIRVRQDLLFVKLSIRNGSNLVYKAQVPVFLMRDKKPKKAANVQEYGIEPIRVSCSKLLIQPQEVESIVLVFKSFSIPGHKQVQITLLEETTGYTGRDLQLTFTNKAIIKAKAL